MIPMLWFFGTWFMLLVTFWILFVAYLRYIYIQKRLKQMETKSVQVPSGNKMVMAMGDELEAGAEKILKEAGILTDLI